MDDDHGKVKVLPDYFEVSVSKEDCPSSPTFRMQPSEFEPQSPSHICSSRRLRKATNMLNLLSPWRFPWGSSRDDEMIELAASELESLHTTIADAEQREAHLKAQLEHLDELLRSARHVGYLFIRMRWAALPGEPPMDDSDVDDWLQRFVVLHGSGIFFYLHSGDISPQDSILLSDVVGIGPLPSFLQEDEQTRFSFYILTRHGLRLECSTTSKLQVDSWLAALRVDLHLESDAAAEDLIKP